MTLEDRDALVKEFLKPQSQSQPPQAVGLDVLRAHRRGEINSCDASFLLYWLGAVPSQVRAVLGIEEPAPAPRPLPPELPHPSNGVDR